MCVAVLLGVLDQRVSERTFQVKMERRLAVLVGEGLGFSGGRRWRRATTVGNNSVQVILEIQKGHSLFLFFFFVISSCFTQCMTFVGFCRYPSETGIFVHTLAQKSVLALMCT